MALWLVNLGPNVLLWGALSAVSLVGATLVLNLLKMLASYVHQWHHMRGVPSMPGCLPFLGHSLIVKPDSREFFKQVISYTEEYRKVSLLKLWLGPMPVVAMYNAEVVEDE